MEEKIENSKQAFIQLIRSLYSLAKSLSKEEFIVGCSDIYTNIQYIKKYRLLPLELLTDSFVDFLRHPGVLDDWKVSLEYIVKTLYVFLARIMFASEVATIYNSAEFKQGLEMCRIQFPFKNVATWLSNIDFNKHEVLDDYFYFFLNPDVHSFKSEEDYQLYKDKISSLGFPKFVEHICPIESSLYENVKTNYEEALRNYRDYIHSNYPSIEDYFDAYNNGVRVYVASRFTSQNVPKGEIQLVYIYEQGGDNSVYVYPYYIDFIHRFYNYERLEERIIGGYYTGFNQNNPTEHCNFIVRNIHFRLHDIFMSLATVAQLKEYLFFMLRARMKQVVEQKDNSVSIDGKLWYLHLENSLTEQQLILLCQPRKYEGFIFSRRPSTILDSILRKKTIEYLTIQDLGVEYCNNSCGTLLHLYIKEHLSELHVDKEKAPRFVKGSFLMEKLNKCKRGSEGWSEYEKLGKEIIDYLFADNFLNYSSELQSTTDDGLCRRDLIINNTPKSSNSIWATLQKRYNSMLIVVDFKNYSESLSATTLYVPTKYLNSKTGTFAIILTREELGESAQKEQIRLISTEDKLLLCLTDKDLLSMLEEKKAGGDVSYRISDKYFSLIKKI